MFPSEPIHISLKILISREEKNRKLNNSKNKQILIVIRTPHRVQYQTQSLVEDRVNSSV